MRLERELPIPHLRNVFEDGMVSILAVMASWERGSHISQTICSCVVVPKDMESLIVAGHEKLGFSK